MGTTAQQLSWQDDRERYDAYAASSVDLVDKTGGLFRRLAALKA